MIGAAGTLAALAAAAAKKETCEVVSIGFDVIGGCLEETNKPLQGASMMVAEITSGADSASDHVMPNRGAAPAVDSRG